MDIKLTKEVNDVTIITGFPGFGLVASIATEFLVDHLKCDLIGRHWFDDAPASLAIHDGNIINPIGVFYNEKYNILIVHSITAAQGTEWKAADYVMEIAKKTNAKKIIALEGVGSSMQIPDNEHEPKLYFHSTEEESRKKMEELKIEQLKEGIILGVTSALMLKTDRPIDSIFAETMSNLPDSKAAAKIIEILDKYLGMEVDYEPLKEQAAKFEEKLKDLVSKSQQAIQQVDEKTMNYFG
jgi:uncharacterized protein